MLLKEITYSILELFRKGSMTDDESLDLRLIELFVKSKRSRYLDTSKEVPEKFYQYLEVDLVMDTFPNEYILKTANKLPPIVSNNYHSNIREITSPDLIQYVFTFVNNGRFRFCGKGKFNKNIIFVTYRDDDLFFTSENLRHLSLTNCVVKAVLEDPKDDPDFDEDTDDYPITMQCYEFIKEAIMKEDVRMFMAGIADTTNDSTDVLK